MARAHPSLLRNPRQAARRDALGVAVIGYKTIHTFAFIMWGRDHGRARGRVSAAGLAGRFRRLATAAIARWRRPASRPPCRCAHRWSRAGTGAMSRITSAAPLADGTDSDPRHGAAASASPPCRRVLAATAEAGRERRGGKRLAAASHPWDHCRGPITGYRDGPLGAALSALVCGEPPPRRRLSGSLAVSLRRAYAHHRAGRRSHSGSSRPSYGSLVRRA